MPAYSIAPSTPGSTADSNTTGEVTAVQKSR